MNKSKEVKDDVANKNKTTKQDAVKRIHTLFDIANG
jgi:hypothetical protein